MTVAPGRHTAPVGTRSARPLAFGLAGLMIGLAVSIAAIKVLTALFPSALPSL